jgi:hypothetical protein
MHIPSSARVSASWKGRPRFRWDLLRHVIGISVKVQGPKCSGRVGAGIHGCRCIVYIVGISKYCMGLDDFEYSSDYALVELGRGTATSTAEMALMVKETSSEWLIGTMGRARITSSCGAASMVDVW